MLKSAMDKYSFLNAAHTSYFAELYEQYLKDPDSIEPSWRAFFQGYDFGSETYGVNGEVVEGVITQAPEKLQHVKVGQCLACIIDLYPGSGEG